MPDNEGFIAYIQRVASLPQEAMEELADCFTFRRYRKGEAVISEHSICRHIYFLNSGLVKLCFTTTDNKEIILRFFTENNICTSLESFLTQAPARFAVIALEDTEAETLSKDRLEDFCTRHHAFETFYRHLLSMASVNMLSRISELMQDDAATRYHKFLTNNGSLMQRISLGELAAYLGITQASLSRIRALR